MTKRDEGLASYKAWLSENKKLEKMGLYGTDHYIKRIEQLEAKVKRLWDLNATLQEHIIKYKKMWEAKLKKKGNK